MKFERRAALCGGMPGMEPGASSIEVKLRREVRMEVWPTGLSTICNGPISQPERLRCSSPLVRWNRQLRGLGDLAGADAGGAHTKGFPGAVDHCMNPLKIGVPPAPSDIVSVAHSISVNRTFAANFAVTRH